MRSVRDASMELPRAVVVTLAVAVIVPLLLFVVGLAPCARLGSVVDEAPAAAESAPRRPDTRPSPPQSWGRRTGCGPPRGLTR